LLLEIALFLIGLVGLWWGSEFVINPVKRIARRLKISEIIIGLTIVSIGTSLPEIFIGLMSGYNKLQGIETSGLAVGQIIGSNVAQITLLLGIVGLAGTLYISKQSLRRDGFMMVFALLAMFIAALDGEVTKLEGIVLALIYVLYLGYLAMHEKIFVKVKKNGVDYRAFMDVLFILAGVMVVVGTAHLVVVNGIKLAGFLELNEVIVGLFVGLGASLPELSISLKGILRGSGSLSLGTLIGSNITDPLFSFGLGAAVAGFSVVSQTLIFDFPFWLVGTLVALFLLHNNTNLSKHESAVLILMYLFFMYMQFFIF
tara:strand:- start:14532 stop:15473 length:942 start_codon:yes stop_codon:yes gene_type:complete